MSYSVLEYIQWDVCSDSKYHNITQCIEILDSVAVVYFMENVHKDNLQNTRKCKKHLVFHCHLQGTSCLATMTLCLAENCLLLFLRFDWKSLLTPLSSVSLSIWLHSASPVFSYPFSFSVLSFLCGHYNISKAHAGAKEEVWLLHFIQINLTFRTDLSVSSFGCFDSPQLAGLVSPLAVECEWQSVVILYCI